MDFLLNDVNEGSAASQDQSIGVWESNNRPTPASVCADVESAMANLCPVGHPGRAASCFMVALCLRTCYDRTGDVALIDQAIELQEEALDLQPGRHPDRAGSCASLAVSLLRRYHRSGDIMALERAICLDQEALDLHPAGHPARAASCVHLAISLRSRYNQTGDVRPFNEAIALTQEALQLAVMGHPERWRCSLQLAQLAQLLPPRLDWDVTVAHLERTFNDPSYDDVNHVLQSVINTILRMDASSMSRSRQQALLILYTSAIDIVALAAGLALDTSARLRHLLCGCALGPAAFSLAVRLDELPAGLQLLERARGVIWSQMFPTPDPRPDLIPSKLATQLQSLIGQANVPSRSSHREAPGSPLSAPRMDYTPRNQVHEILRYIRSLPRLSDFMVQPDIEVLLDAASQNPVVVLVADQGGCHALLIRSGERPLTHIVLPNMSRQTLQGLTFEGMICQKRGAPAPLDVAARGMVVVGRGTSPLRARLAKLWRSVVKPIIEHMQLPKTQGRARPRLHWCPTGPFAFMPVHAAGVYEGPNQERCSDYVVSSYTPTIAALVQARQGTSTFATRQMRLMTVASETSQDPKMPALPFAMLEIRGVADVAKKAGFSGVLNVTSKADILTALHSSQVVHFACHGIQLTHEPHKSHFCLSNSNLTVLELTQMQLKNPFLAYLSACETAKGDKEHADEAIHLAASMLFAGFKSVVATMWAMNDADGPFVAKEFYTRLFQGRDMIDVGLVPYALDDAATALRAKGVPPEQWATFIHMGA